MDMISLLPDDLVLTILALVPTKDAVTSSLLSKRWRSLWKLVPKLDFRDPPKPSRATRFVKKFYLLHKAPVLETLYLAVNRDCPPKPIERWMSVAVSRGVRDLQVIREYICSSLIQLPRSLYTCETLVTLTLTQATIIDVPLKICLRSLKTLVLALVNFSCDENVPRFLSGCPVLEQLTLARQSNDNVKTFTIIVPSLLILKVVAFRRDVAGDHYVIKAPSLQSLTIFDTCRHSSFSLLAKMPNLIKANIYGHCPNVVECVTSASSELYLNVDSYPTCFFHHLVSLTLRACSFDWFRLILGHTPMLRVLRSYGDFKHPWEQPSFVPQCLISSLETVEWTDYKGTEAEKKVAIYLLENTRQLKTMAIRSLTSTTLQEKHMILLELASARRSSSKCRLSFT